MATANEILGVFTQQTSISNADQVLIQAANGVGNKAVKVTAEVISAYLLNSVLPAVNSDGYLTIGGSSTGVRVKGVTPQLRNGDDGIYVSNNEGKSWTLLVSYADLIKSDIIPQTETTVSIAPNVLNRWGAVDGLNLILGGSSATSVSEYMLEFTVGSEEFTFVTVPQVKWSDEPEWENGYTYHVSILNGMAVGAGFGDS